MEAATPLRNPSVRVLGDRVAIDGLVVADECAVRLVREGDDPVRVVEDAIEIGVRVLDREQTGANAEFVRSEFDKTAREVQTVFTDGAREMQQQMERRFEEVFGPEGGALAKLLGRYFSDESSAAVQHQVRALVEELMVKSRDDMRRLFSAQDGHNPLADLKGAVLATVKQADERQTLNLRGLDERMAKLQQEMQALRDEKQKLEELEVERERGTAKGRSFEELVAEAIDAVAAAQGDDCDAVGDLRGSEGRAGDVVVSIDACNGPARGRIVFEVKNSKLSKPRALADLDKGMRDRDADFAVLVVPTEEKVPARMRPLREYNGDKLIVAYDPDDDNGLALEIAYSLARARVLMSRSESEGVDTAAVHDTVERALGALEDVKRVKSTLSGATTQIQKAREIVDEMAGRVREHLNDIDELAAGSDDAEADEAEAGEAEADEAEGVPAENTQQTLE
ncbi:MAG: DUF2130 domain-containing protein [Gaiellaceae bacterium]